jgi:hypothetical protein
LKPVTTITIDIRGQQAAVLAAKAKARGMTLEDWFRQVAAKEAAPEQPAKKTDLKEWERKFEEWIGSHDPNKPVLSDEAISRDSIYPDRS